MRITGQIHLIVDAACCLAAKTIHRISLKFILGFGPKKKEGITKHSVLRALGVWD